MAAVLQPNDPLQAPAYVRAIAPYQPGKPIEELAREYALDPANIIKLASNENPLGMPESARRAIGAALADLGRYPDANGFALKLALAHKSGGTRARNAAISGPGTNVPVGLCGLAMYSWRVSGAIAARIASRSWPKLRAGTTM